MMEANHRARLLEEDLQYTQLEDDGNEWKRQKDGEAAIHERREQQVVNRQAQWDYAHRNQHIP